MRSFIAIAAALLIATTAAAETIVVGPAKKTVRFVVLETEVPEPAAAKRPRLVDLSSGKTVPCQVIGAAQGKARIAWLLSRLESGKTASYGFSWTDDEPPSTSHAISFGGDRERALDVNVGGKLFTRHLHDADQFKPYLYPVLLDGVALTRHFPMKKGVEGERSDHPHHRSFSFTHGDVNGVSFWHEGSNAGRIVHRGFHEIWPGPVAGTLKTRSEWVMPGGEVVLDDRRTYRFVAPADGVRIVDLSVKLTATDERVTLGDTKEGTFGIRVAGWMKETSGGRVETSRGVIGARDAWGKPAEWLDYTAQHGGKTYGIAILDHPSSFRFPTHWHIRDYGLFAANPFGYHDFYRKKTKEGNHTLARGEWVTFSYRVVFHEGDTKAANIAEIYDGWAKPLTIRLE